MAWLKSNALVIIVLILVSVIGFYMYKEIKEAKEAKKTPGNTGIISQDVADMIASGNAELLEV